MSDEAAAGDTLATWRARLAEHAAAKMELDQELYEAYREPGRHPGTDPEYDQLVRHTWEHSWWLGRFVAQLRVMVSEADSGVIGSATLPHIESTVITPDLVPPLPWPVDGFEWTPDLRWPPLPDSGPWPRHQV